MPYFGKRKISEITTKDVIAWQNEMLAYLDLRESFNRLSRNYDRLQQRCGSLDASIDQLVEENTGLKQVAADYDTLCRGYGADRVEEQVRAIRAQETERKRQRRVQWQRIYMNTK